MILSTARDVLHGGGGRDMSIWPFGGNCFLATRNGEDVDKGFPEPFGRSLGCEPEAFKTRLREERNTSGIFNLLVLSFGSFETSLR